MTRQFKKLIPLLLLLFGLLIAFCLDEYYRSFVTQILALVYDNKIRFVGKNFHLFPSTIFLFSFGWFLSLSYILTKSILVDRLKKIVISILVFSTTLISLIIIDGKRLIVECTMCLDGVKKIGYNELPYDSYFIVSLCISFCYFLTSFLIELRNSKTKT